MRNQVLTGEPFNVNMDHLFDNRQYLASQFEADFDDDDPKIEEEER